MHGTTIAKSSARRITMHRFLHAALLGAALLVSSAIAPTVLRAQTYHDVQRKEDHHWDAHEGKAYRMWVKENHRKYADFAKLKAEDQQAYWDWRHEHTDAVLKIEVK
jgi:hypothetical protein